MKKSFILFSLFLSTQTFAYDPMAKLECRQSISATEFMYSAVEPAALRGHPFQFRRYENGEVNVEGDSLVKADLSGDKLKFTSDKVDLELEVSPEDNESEYFIGVLKYAGEEYHVSCDYFVPIDEIQE